MARTILRNGKLVTPGLFDCHVDFMADGNFSAGAHGSTPFSLNFYQAAERMTRTIECGITTVREAGGADLGVKEAQELGLISGPRMQISITILSQTGGHVDSWEVCGAHMPGMLDSHPGRPHGVVDGPADMRVRVREIIRAGADVIKVCTSGGVLSPRDDPQHAHYRAEELEMLVAEASAAHLFVMAHAQATEGIKNATRADIRSIEHGIYLDDIYLDDAAIQMMLDAGTYLVHIDCASGCARRGRSWRRSPRLRPGESQSGGGGPSHVGRQRHRSRREDRNGYGFRRDPARTGDHFDVVDLQDRIDAVIHGGVLVA